MRIPTAIASLVLAAAITSMAVSQETLRWEDNLDTALAKAAASNRLAFVEFTAPWCGVCRQMHNEVLSLPEVEMRLGTAFIPVKVNVDHYPNLGKKYGVTGLPTIAIIAPDGRCLEQHRGKFTRDELLLTLSRFEPRRQIASAAPRQTAVPPATPYGARQSPVTMAAPPYRPPVNASTPSPAETQGRYANPYQGPYQQSMDQPPQADTSGAPDYGGPSIPGLSRDTQAPSAPAEGNIGRENPAFAPGQPYRTGPDTSIYRGESAPYGNAITPNRGNPPVPPMVTPTVPPMAPPATPPNSGRGPIDPDAVNSSQILPAAQAPIALDGFCPVTLTESRAWKKGDPRWGVEHEGRIYLFTGPAEKQRFFDNPNQYSPVLSGMDVVLYMDRGEQRPGTREHGVFFEGRVYLFSSEESLQQFTGKPHQYASGIARGLGHKADLPQRTSYR